MGLLSLFDDPLAVARDWDGFTLQIHSPLPEYVPIGHYSDGGREVIERHLNRADYLDRVRQACASHGADYTVRFYDHFSEGYDAAILDQLPEIEALSIDGIYEINNMEAVARLPRLKRLNFSPRGKQPSDVLTIIDAQRLEWLTLGETFEPPTDLTPLGASTGLLTLRLLSRGKHVEALGNCASLVELSMHPSDKDDLGFINRLPQLEVLKFSLGRLTSLEGVGPLPKLKDLSFDNVALLEELGDLQRFPGLRRLQISYQRRLKRLRLGPGNVALEHINIDGIDEIDGFSELPALKSFWNFDGKFAPDWSELPATLTNFALVTPSLKKREKHFAEVRARGLTPERHPDALFFYK